MADLSVETFMQSLEYIDAHFENKKKQAMNQLKNHFVNLKQLKNLCEGIMAPKALEQLLLNLECAARELHNTLIDLPMNKIIDDQWVVCGKCNCDDDDVESCDAVSDDEVSDEVDDEEVSGDEVGDEDEVPVTDSNNIVTKQPLTLDSKILCSTELDTIMVTLLNSNGKKNLSDLSSWKLIYACDNYNGTKKFDATEFHSHCDSKPNTMIIVKANSCIFGGFTKANWNHTLDNSGEPKNDPSAFIFSLTNKEGKPILMNHNCSTGTGSVAIFADRNSGPIFGFSDLAIHNRCYGSYSHLGGYYDHPSYANETFQANEFLAGSKKFTIDRMEVYQILDLS